MPAQKRRIAVIPGDGIGKEVVPEGVRVLEVAAKRFGIDLHLDHPHDITPSPIHALTNFRP